MKKLFGIFLYALAVLGILVFPSQIDKNRGGAPEARAAAVAGQAVYESVAVIPAAYGTPR